MRTQLLKQSVIIILISILGYVTQYLFHIYIANLLPAEDYGDVAVALSLAAFWSFIIQLGGSRTIQKYIPWYLSLNDYNRLSGLLRTYIYLIISLGWLVASITTLLAFGEAKFTHKSTTDGSHPLVLVLWFLPFIGLCSLSGSLLKSFRVYFISEFPLTFGIFSCSIIFILFYRYFGFAVSDWNLVYLFGSANFLMLVIYLIMIKHYLPAELMRSKPRYEIKKWLTTSIPIMLSLLIFVALKQIDLFFLDMLLPDENGVGYFSAASQSAQVLITIYTSLNMLFSPYIGERFLHGREEMKKALMRMAEITSIFCIPLFILFIFFGKHILQWFGSSYITAYPALIIIAGGYTVNAIFGSYITFLQHADRHFVMLMIQCGALIVDVVLNILLIPLFGITGSAIATATALIGVSILAVSNTLLHRPKQSKKLLLAKMDYDNVS